MFLVQKLDEHIINQIKAGEVVERPVSVVKELVENALDASASEITVELVDGGKQSIVVIDNGSGMAQEDALLAIERHATSKLRTVEDLLSIGSFGFRGEALPSIASVSQMTIRTRQANDRLAFEFDVVQGKAEGSRSVTGSVGTTIIVKELFATLPVRRKFLKATATEFAHVLEFMTSLSFAYPNVKFRLIHNGRQAFESAPAQDLPSKIRSAFQLSGDDFAPISFSRGRFSLSGVVGLPHLAKAAPKPFLTFVNGRLVRDKSIRAGLLQGMTGYVMKGEICPVVIFVTMDPSWIDVNVHPAKTEIRIFDALAVQEWTAEAVSEALRSRLHAEASPPPLKKFEPALPDQRQGASAHFFSGEAKRVPSAASFTSHFTRAAAPGVPSEPAPLAVEQLVVAVSGPFADAKYVGQFFKCFLVFEVSKELWIVDQHAFHERILFEELMCEYQQRGALGRQGMLIAEAVPGNAVSHQMLREHQEALRKLGFVFQFDDHDTAYLTEFPAMLGQPRVAAFLEELLAKMDALETTPTFAALYHLFFATAACHAAVRAGEELNAELVRRLMLRAKDVDFFAHCPHGRPVLRKFREDDVLGWFSRI